MCPCPKRSRRCSGCARWQAGTTGAIRLGAVVLPALPWPPGSQLLLTFYWQAVQPLDRNWNVLVRLVGLDGVTDLARARAGLRAGPPSIGRPGAVSADGHTLVIPPDAAPGPYSLWRDVSFYDAATLELLGDGPGRRFCGGGGPAGLAGGSRAGSLAGATRPLARFGDCIELLAVAAPVMAGLPGPCSKWA